MDFQYKARGIDGSVMSGTRSAASQSEIVDWIKGQGWIPLDISRIFDSSSKKSFDTTGSAAASEFFDLSPRIKLKDKLVFFKQLSTMISSGVTVSRSIEILMQQTQNRRFRRVITNLHKRVSSGVALADAMAEHPKVFDLLSYSLIKAGEESGTLDVSLVRLAGFLESQENLRKKIISAFTYPIAVMMIAFLVLGVMVTVVVPQFQKAFENINVPLPTITLIIFDLGTWAKDNWYTVPIAVILLVMLIYFLKRMESLKYPIDVAFLKIPIFGGIIYKASIARSFRTMSSLLDSGVPILKTLELAGDVSGNEKIRKGFIMMREGAIMGVPINTVMKEQKLFPPMISHMVAVGEETGRTNEMLAKIAEWYEVELEEIVKRLSSLLEPILVIFVGGVVGIMVMAIFMPIISAIQAFM